MLVKGANGRVGQKRGKRGKRGFPEREGFNMFAWLSFVFMISLTKTFNPTCSA